MPIATAAERFGGQVAFVYPTRYPGTPGQGLARGSLRAARRVYEYGLLAIDIWRARHSRIILVREFSTYYIWLTALVCLPLMRKVALIVAHNVQSAQSSRLQRQLLVALARIGTRFICVEDTSGCLSILPPSLHLAVVHMPSPVAPAGRPAPAREVPGPGDPLVVGFAGDFRPEKGLRAVVERLSGLSVADGNIRVLVGAPRVEQTARDLGTLDETVDFFDTTLAPDYFSFLSALHVLVIPYPGSNYRHRASGPIADACACGTPVLATDLPVLRAQVTTPAQGGVCLGEGCFASDSCLRAALSQLRAHWLDYSTGMTANANARSVDVVASVISRLLLHEEPSAQASQEEG